jgi:hypothetical protein
MLTSQIPSVAEEPVVDMVSWSIFSVLRANNARTHHFVGALLDGEYRVSSRIVHFNHISMIGTTDSGRQYRLKGISRYNKQSEEVLRHWMTVKLAANAMNVTDTYVRMNSYS